ncbi:hypothetical protein E2C01_098218 [Portunus trituberculatus]|uniref:Uncharacterized protein n=1 Tax=Portunus trituberculatus TaxID=210409 RepID=A0A5B7K7P7_PORTR|nr:hypothetical protein [Portunus trituberculatus]
MTVMARHPPESFPQPPLPSMFSYPCPSHHAASPGMGGLTKQGTDPGIPPIPVTLSKSCQLNPWCFKNGKRSK